MYPSYYSENGYIRRIFYDENKITIDGETDAVFAEDVEKIFGKRPWASRSEEIMNKEEGQFLPTNGQEEKSESENKEE